MSAIEEKITQTPQPRHMVYVVNHMVKRRAHTSRTTVSRKGSSSVKPLGELEQLTLLAVVRLRDVAYSISVLEELGDVAGRSLDRATAYVTLQRLEDKGLLSSRLGDPTPERGGRAKRYYRLTAVGERALRQSVGAIRRLSEGLEAWLEC